MRAKLVWVLALATIGCGVGCVEPDSNPGAAQAITPPVGPWRVAINMDTTGEQVQELPFRLVLEQEQGKWLATIQNQDERIKVDSVSVAGDSVLIRMPLFNWQLAGVMQGDSAIIGQWTNHEADPPYSMPFTARAGELPRFNPTQGEAAINPSGEWEAHFTNAGRTRPALGIFKMDGNRVKGSFATQSGDMRFLEGVMTGDSLYLSTFGNAMAVLFRASLHGDTLVGTMRSGRAGLQTWYAVRNPDFALADAESITELVAEVPVDFSFPDQNGQLRSMADARYEQKVLAVEIMGTWCPNCIDAAHLLTGFDERYADQGFAVVALAFERTADTAVALPALRRYKERLGIPYNILYAGLLHSDTVRAKLPYIKQIRAYPTTLLIDRAGRVRHIYTGMDGPGTGDRYRVFKQRMEQAIQQLLNEPA